MVERIVSTSHVLGRAASSVLDAPGEVARHVSDVLISGAASHNAAVIRRPAEAETVQRHRPTFQSAGRRVVGAVRFLRATRPEDDNAVEEFPTEMDEDDSEEEEEGKHIQILRRLGVAAFVLIDNSIMALIGAIGQYPVLKLRCLAVVANEYRLCGCKGDPFPGALRTALNLGMRGLFEGFAPIAVASVVQKVSSVLPTVAFIATTGRGLSTEAKKSLASIGTVTAGLAPMILLEIIWARQAFVGGSEYATISAGANEVLSARPWMTWQGLWAVPWYTIPGRLFGSLDGLAAVIPMYMPVGHAIAFHGTWFEAVKRTWNRLKWSEFWYSFWVNASCSFVAAVPSQCISLSVAFCYGFIKGGIAPKLFSEHEKSLEAKLRLASEHTESIRGRVDIASLRRAKPNLARMPTAVLKQNAAVGLDTKRGNLNASWEKYQSDHVRAPALFGVPLLPNVRITVDRSQPEKSLFALARASSSALQLGNLSVSYKGEQGIDAGGLRRDYMRTIANAISKHNVFEVGPDQGLLPKTLPASQLKKDEEVLFAVGRLLALSIIIGVPLDVNFSRCLYKLLLEEPIGATDVARIDPDFYKHRVKALLQPGGVATMEAALCDQLVFVGTPIAGGAEEELVKGGRGIRVTEGNKERYVTLLVEHYLVGHSRTELALIVDGFRDIIPKKVLKRAKINAIELELIIAGLPVMDLDDWRKHTKGDGNTENAELRDWFFEILAEMDVGERAKVLSFACGSGRLPADGFKGLSPPFNIRVMTNEDICHVPTSHTCANQLCLPKYSSKEQLREQLQKAIKFDAGFGFM